MLLSNPVHYRDSRTEGMLKMAFSRMDRERLYEITGSQFMEINTAFQLMAEQEYRKELLEQAENMLLMPDLFSYFLSGRWGASIPSLQPHRCWMPLKKTGLKRYWKVWVFLPDIKTGAHAGNPVGSLRNEIQRSWVWDLWMS